MQKLTQDQKESLKAAADKHVRELGNQLEQESQDLLNRSVEYRENLKEFADIDIDDAASDDAFKELAIAKVQLLEGMAEDLMRIKDSPYFVRIDVVWEQTQESETLYFGKAMHPKEGIYSWVSPISTLRYAEIGDAKYDKPDGNSRKAKILRKDNFLITGGDIVFMTHQDQEYDRQVVFQKHLNERKEFLLPEIVAELDQLQDQIIRSDPKGPFLISGPAGSGKTTLALHRVAYLVLTPEFRDYFDPERIVVFVSNQSDIDYFSKLLPELGINGVRITTFMEWASLVVNSRYTVKTKDRFKPQPNPEAVEFISEQDPESIVPARLRLDEYRKLKQELIHQLEIPEGRPRLVYSSLHEWYLTGVSHLEGKDLAQFKQYLKFQKDNKYLDEVDLVILIKSLFHPPKQYVHVVVDEVQNWTPEQLDIVSKLATRTMQSITFIGDIRQKTKAFTISDWGDVNEEFSSTGPRQVDLLKVYRNSNPILKHLREKGYDVEENPAKPEGSVDQQMFSDPESQLDTAKELIDKLKAKNKQVGVLARYQTSIERLEYLGHADDQVHVLAVEEAQGLEFDTVIIIDAQNFEQDFSDLQPPLSQISADEYTDQSRHLYYVAVTRAKQDVHVFSLE